MCIYIVKKQKIKIKKNTSKGVRDSTEGILSGVKDIAKTDKDLGMSCYIQVEYSVFPLVALF